MPTSCCYSLLRSMPSIASASIAAALTIGTIPIKQVRLFPTAARLEQATHPDPATQARLGEAQRVLEALVPKIRDIVWPLGKAGTVTVERPGTHLVLTRQLT